jgi:hypothetical protein
MFHLNVEEETVFSSPIFIPISFTLMFALIGTVHYIKCVNKYKNKHIYTLFTSSSIVSEVKNNALCGG